MSSWKVILIGASVAVANTAIAIPTNLTGQRTPVTTLPSLKMDLSQIAYATGHVAPGVSQRPIPLIFPFPQRQTGEIVLSGAFDGRRADGSLMEPSIDLCPSVMFLECGGPQISSSDGPGASALRFNLGLNAGPVQFSSDLRDVNRILNENGNDLENFAGGAL